MFWSEFVLNFKGLKINLNLHMKEQEKKIIRKTFKIFHEWHRV